MNDGWIVCDLAGRPVSAGPTPDAAIETAETLGVMPLRARISPITSGELNDLDLPPAAFGVEDDESPWWQQPPSPGRPSDRNVELTIRISKDLHRRILAEASSRHLSVEAWIANIVEPALVKVSSEAP